MTAHVVHYRQCKLNLSKAISSLKLSCACHLTKKYYATLPRSYVLADQYSTMRFGAPSVLYHASSYWRGSL